MICSEIMQGLQRDEYWTRTQRSDPVPLQTRSVIGGNKSRRCNTPSPDHDNRRENRGLQELRDSAHETDV